jgi:hypothetical protein
LLLLSPIVLLTLVGAGRAVVVGETRSTTAWLLAAWVIWLGVWVITPNAATYHIAGALVLGAALGAHAIRGMAAKSRGWTALALGLVLSLCLTSAPLRSGLGGWVNGHTYPLARVAWLLDEVRSRGGGCLCLVPWHPIFIPTVSPVYVSNERNSRRWGEALEWAARRRPAAVMSRRFNLMAERERVSQSQVDQLMKILKQHYELRSAGSAGFWLLKTGH